MDNQAAGKRLNKYMADSGYCSRREADRLIREGRVKLDGRTGALGDRVQPGMAVTVDGKPLSGAGEKVYLLLNKPKGIVCTADPREPMNVVDYLGYPRRVFPVGRLDKDSEGLLLLTSDGDIVNRVLRAAGGHEKEYEVTIDRPVTPEFVRRLSGGVPILDMVTLPCKVRRTLHGRVTVSRIGTPDDIFCTNSAVTGRSMVTSYSFSWPPAARSMRFTMSPSLVSSSRPSLSLSSRPTGNIRAGWPT